MSTVQPTYLQSFGRRRSRKLRANRDALVETLLPKLLIELPLSSPSLLAREGRGAGQSGKDSATVLPPSPTLPRKRAGELNDLPRKGGGDIDPACLFPNPGPLWFEIGFGGGEHLIEQARLHPEINFIGCEPFINGMASLLAEVQKHALGNIRLFSGDARLLLERLPDDSIERLFVLFPDPWPKVRHHKRRIISQETLGLFYAKMTSAGLLRLATDHVDYSVWILEQLLAFQRFTWQAECPKDWQNPPSDWVPTRYQKKALAEGRKGLFLDWRKT